MSLSDRSAPVPFLRLFLRMGGWVPLIFAGLLLLFTAISSAELRTAQLFDQEGIEAAGQITDKYTRETRDSDGNKRTTYYVTVEFKTRAGALVSVSPSVSRNAYSETTVGHPIGLWYLQSRPDKIELERGSHRQAYRITYFVAGGLGLAMLGSLWYFGRHTVAAVRARRYGARENAVVTGIEKTNYRVNKKHRYRLIWREASGRVGQSLPHRESALEAYAPGQTITVYQGLKKAFWVGDVGERAQERSPDEA